MHKMDIPFYNVEQTMFEATQQDGRTRLKVYRPEDNLVVLGRGSQPQQELFMEHCLEDQIPLLRRRGGGCAVVLDPGNLIVSTCLTSPGIGNHLYHFGFLSEWLLDTLKRVGVEGIHRAGISDLAIGEHKVAGACLYRSKNTLLFSSSLLVEPNLHLIERYLRHPPREPEYRKRRSHSQFLMGLSKCYPDLEAESLLRHLRQRLTPPNYPNLSPKLDARRVVL